MLTPDQLAEIIANGEKLDVEFKSDLKCLSDRDLTAAVVALAKRWPMTAT